MIDVPRLRAAAGMRHIQWLDEVDSTNNYALRLASNLDAPLPFLIGTERQTAGRGRGANSWWAAEGSLLFSVGVKMPDLGLSTLDWPRFSLLTGLAIADTIASFLPASCVGVKWPNDVWVNGKKVCGILIEQPDRTSDRLIVGIGINVNNSLLNASDDYRQIATSLIDAADGTPLSRTDILLVFLARWRSLVEQLVDGAINIAERWSHACVLSGRAISVTNGTNELTGICSGIDEDGCLLLRTAFAMERCYAGTVRLLDP